MNEQEQAQAHAVAEIRKKLTEIRDGYNRERSELLREQDAHGFTETINGGYTFRLGNEVKDFERAFGVAADQE